MKPWLVVDTATPIAVVGVWTPDGARSEHRLSETRRHAEGIVDAIDAALLVAGVELGDLAGVAVGKGPGSFIGVRTGIATAKGICVARALPLVGVSTLLALAHSAKLPRGIGLIAVDARRGEVYAQLLENAAGGVRPVEPAQPMPPDAARARARALAFVAGSGLDLDTAGMVEHESVIPLVSPSVEGLGRALLARIARGLEDETESLVPDYCRPPDAKLPATDPAARRGLAR